MGSLPSNMDEVPGSIPGASNDTFAFYFGLEETLLGVIDAIDDITRVIG